MSSKAENSNQTDNGIAHLLSEIARRYTIVEKEAEVNRNICDKAAEKCSVLEDKVIELEEQLSRKDQELQIAVQSETAAKTETAELKQQLATREAAVLKADQLLAKYDGEMTKLQQQQQALLGKTVPYDEHKQEIDRLKQQLLAETQQRQLLEVQHRETNAKLDASVKECSKVKQDIRKMHQVCVAMQNAFQRAQRDGTTVTIEYCPTSFQMPESTTKAPKVSPFRAARNSSANKPPVPALKSPDDGIHLTQPERLVSSHALSVLTQATTPMCRGPVNVNDTPQAAAKQPTPIQEEEEEVEEELAQTQPISEDAAAVAVTSPDSILDEPLLSSEEHPQAAVLSRQNKRKSNPSSTTAMQQPVAKKPASIISPPWKNAVKEADVARDLAYTPLEEDNPYELADVTNNINAITGSQNTALPPLPGNNNNRKAAAAGVGGEHRYQEVVRKKHDRQKLPAFECAGCKPFWDALASWGSVSVDTIPLCGHVEASRAQLGTGVITKDDLRQEAGRHRFRWTPPETPPRFWQIGFDDSPSQRPVMMPKSAEQQQVQQQ